MRNLSCIIVEDEELGRVLLKKFISRVSHLELVGEFIKPTDALEFVESHSVDLLFLDIQMPEMTGIEFVKTLSFSPAVIFTTAYENFAIEGFELSAIDYLLKPFDYQRFLKAVNKASELINFRYDARKDQHSLFSLERAEPSKYLLIKADYKVHRLYLKDIIYIQSMKEYVVYYSEQEKIMALGSLKNLEDTLPSYDFIRIHKSYLVAKKMVKSLEGNQLNLENISLPIGGVYRQEVLTSLF